MEVVDALVGTTGGVLEAATGVVEVVTGVLVVVTGGAAVLALDSLLTKGSVVVEITTRYSEKIIGEIIIIYIIFNNNISNIY